MTSCEETSCSDCKLELIEKKWTKLLLNWLNKCIHTKSRVSKLNSRSILQVVSKYKQDINLDEIDRAFLSTYDIESFLKYKYPILRLRYFSGEKDLPKKIYIMLSILLFHCCVSSLEGMVDSDICKNLTKAEQEMILKFCERLSDMEVTCNNIECAIKDACDIKHDIGQNKRKKHMGDSVSHASSRLSALHTESEISSEYFKSSFKGIPLKPLVSEQLDKKPANFKSSVTVLPSAIIGTTSLSDAASDNVWHEGNVLLRAEDGGRDTDVAEDSGASTERRCQPECACARCSATGPCCGDPGNSMDQCYSAKEKSWMRFWRKLNWKIYLAISLIILLIVILLVLAVVFKSLFIPNVSLEGSSSLMDMPMEPLTLEQIRFTSLLQNSWECKNNLCQKVYAEPTSPLYKSLSRCILLCMGPQLWPIPIGETQFSKKVVALATNKLEYKFKTVNSDPLNRYLAEAFKLFLTDLVMLERIKDRNDTEGLTVKKMNIQIEVQTDVDPRLRIDTDEGYRLRIEEVSDQLVIKITSVSFCGVRHGLETMSQLILLDQSSGYLITLSDIIVKDAPSYKYRGLMIDTARNYIPIPDLIRTIDTMATCKLNTFHWRISDATSFPLFLPKLPQLFEYGGYDLSLVYTKDDVRNVVNRAGVRGIRVLIEVAMPGPVGRAWSWSKDASCPHKNGNYSCNNVLCLRLKMQEAVFDALQIIYSEIINMTKVDDVFHLSDGVFSLVNCYNLLEEREGFLDKALARLKMANKGFLPKLPIIWYSEHLNKEFESRTWDRLGVQFNNLQQNPSDQFLSRYRVIHSSRWDLSCTMKKRRCQKYRTWQSMYSWKSWKNIEAFTLEGGEAVLWTDLVDSSNLDYHLWPRAAAVAERLWSDVIANSSATASVYVRLDIHRWRMLLRSVKVQPIWPVWCSFNPGVCLQKLN